MPSLVEPALGKKVRHSVCQAKALAEDTQFAGLIFLRG